MRKTSVYLNEFLIKNEIKTSIRFDKDMETIYDLSYFLVDFQAVINNLTDMICNQREIQQDYISQYKKDQSQKQETYYLENSYSQRQKEIERNRELILFQPERAVANRDLYPRKGLKQTTQRRFNKKYRMNMQLKGFSKGSLVLDIINSLLVSIIAEFIKELLVKKTGNEKVININIENGFICIDDSFVKMIPKNACLKQAINIDTTQNTNVLDVEKCAHDIVESAKPDEEVEESVKRFFSELYKNHLIDDAVFYDYRGIKTAVNDIERFTGHFIDLHV